MWSFIRHEATYFLVGFILTSVVYLKFKLSWNEVVVGLAIGAVGGLVVAGGIFWLERRFPDDRKDGETPGTDG
jgi:hypothetical protein